MSSHTFQPPIIAPSILSADFTQLGSDIQKSVEGGAKWIHCDIMDGHFVPNISYGADIVAAARRAAPGAFLDVHLMIENPDAYLNQFIDAGADLVSVHQEASTHLHRTLQGIKEAGALAGVAINPATPVETLLHVLELVDLVVVMSVNPGFGGQSFIPSALEKVRKLVEMRREAEEGFLIEIDGGVTLDNAAEIVSAGTDILVAGSTIFRSKDITATTAELTRRANEASGSDV